MAERISVTAWAEVAALFRSAFSIRSLSAAWTCRASRPDHLEARPVKSMHEPGRERAHL